MSIVPLEELIAKPAGVEEKVPPEVVTVAVSFGPPVHKVFEEWENVASACGSTVTQTGAVEAEVQPFALT